MREKIKIEEIGNRIPFKTPDNYFENFAAQFEEQVMVKPVSAFKLMRPWMYMAAMFLGVFFMSRILFTVYSNNKAEAAAENYELYVMTQVNDVESFEIYNQSSGQNLK